MNIERITSRQILDSKGHPTLETTVWLDTGDSGTASVPAGASTGSHEMAELRDGGESFGGRAVTQAVKNVTTVISKALAGKDVRDQAMLDQVMIDADGTVNKAQLGANAILSVSLASLRAHANLTKRPVHEVVRELAGRNLPNQLPRPMMNIINGGLHAYNRLKVQEFLIIPAGNSAAEIVEKGVAVYSALWSLLRERKLSTLVGDEGGFGPDFKSEDEALEALVESVQRAGLTLKTDIDIGIDAAASEFYDPGKQRYMISSAHGLSGLGMIGLIEEWAEKYSLKTVEDPLQEDDWENWKAMTEKLGSRLTLIGDDLFVTSPERIARGIENHVANAVLIKPNQVGTVTETLTAIHRAREAGYTIIASHRSGETNDPMIVDIGYGAGADYLKIGAPARGERVAKYNRYLGIELEQRE